MTSGHGSRVSVLGDFRFKPEREPLLVLSGSSQRLLAFLALHERPVGRNAVAGTLWPEASEVRAYSSLRSALSRMHGSTREAVVVSVMDLSLASDVSVDVRESQALAHRLLDARTGALSTDLSRDSIDALSADLLPNWFDDWVMVETEAWRQLRLHALEALSGRLVDAGRLADAAGAALAAVNAEPLRESSRAALIRVHLSEGNQSEALTEFERYRVLLHAELGLEPTRRLGELLEGLRRR